MVKSLQKLSLLLVTSFCLGSNVSWAQVNLSGGNYQQNFDGMGATGTTLPTGWYALRLSGSGTANEALSPVVTIGDANSGAVYNVGAAGSSERALGSLGSGSTVPAFGVMFTNTSGSTITQLSLSAVMEQWRSGSAADITEKVEFEYSTDATSLSTGTWTAVTALDLVEKLTSTTSAAAVDGNLEANKTAITGTITLQLANNSSVWLRWKDTNDGGSDGIYAIDDLVVTPTYSNATGIKDFSKGKIGFYPNPTSGNSNLKFPVGFAAKGIASITVYSPNGKVLLKTSGSEQALNQQLSSKLSSAAAGVYIVKIDGTGESFQTRIVKN